MLALIFIQSHLVLVWYINFGISTLNTPLFYVIYAVLLMVRISKNKMMREQHQTWQ